MCIPCKPLDLLTFLMMLYLLSFFMLVKTKPSNALNELPFWLWVVLFLVNFWFSNSRNGVVSCANKHKIEK